MMEQEQQEIARESPIVGRPTAFREEYIEVIQNLAFNGATDIEIAEVLRVNPSTLYNWKKVHKVLFKSIKAGKQAADTRVVRSLYRNALDGNTTAQIFWLKNRQPDQWRDRTEVALDAVELLGERLARARKRLGSGSNDTGNE